MTIIANLSKDAYTKMYLHAAKYPNNSIGGFIIGSKNVSNNEELLITSSSSSSSSKNKSKNNFIFDINDIVPICHSNPVGPIFELAGSIVDTSLDSSNSIIGYYYSPELSKNNGELSSSYIDKLSDVISKNNNDSCIIIQIQGELMNNCDVLCIDAKMADESKVELKTIDTITSLNDIIDNLLQKKSHVRKY
jgi:hypothetical protein